MKQFCFQMWHDEQGILTFEWVLILTLLVIGVVGATTAVRDAISVELVDVAGAATALDLSYNVTASSKYGLGTAFQYKSATKHVCASRQDGTIPQPAVCTP